jgi:hypothetical protein
MDPLVIMLGEALCRSLSGSAQCYDPDHGRALGFTILSMAGLAYFGTRLLRSP